MRSLAFFLSVFSALPVALVFPFVGLLLWAWISFGNLHRETYGAAYDFAFNYYVAAATLTAWLYSANPKSLPNQILPILVLAFTAHVSLSTYFAIDQVTAWEFWEQHIKTFLLVLVIMGLTTSRLRIQALLWVMALSLGYFAAKGAGFMLLTGSIGSRVFGPVHSMISDNNNLSLALVLTIPILHYLRATTQNPMVKTVCLVTMLSCIVAIVGTYSRGGFIGLTVVGIVLSLFTSRRLAAILMTGLIGLLLWNYAPTEWKERIGGIGTYDKDSSAVGRVNAWQTSFNLAEDRPILGGGFSAIQIHSTYLRYRSAGDETDARAAHSIWFQVLGDHGFVGLAIYFSILGAALYNLFSVYASTRQREDLDWANLLSRMMLASFAGFITAGSFLSMAYYDMFLGMVGLSAALRAVVMQSLEKPAEADVEPEPEMGPMVPAWRAASRRMVTRTPGK